MGLGDQIATPDGKRRYVRRLFATIADRYDWITIALSYGQDRRWKRRLVEMGAPRSGMRALDLATGTGDIAFAIAARGADVVGLDITARMIEIAQGKIGRDHHPAGPARPAHPARPAFVIADMLALPFPDESFDLVTTGYGLRNVPDLRLAIDEIRRVLRPGGRLLSLDFDRPENAPLRLAYLSYLNIVGGTLGLALHGDPDTYRYIPASIRQYPGARRVAELMRERGFSSAVHYPVLSGLMAIHDAVRG